MDGRDGRQRDTKARSPKNAPVPVPHKPTEAIDPERTPKYDDCLLCDD